MGDGRVGAGHLCGRNHTGVRTGVRVAVLLFVVTKSNQKGLDKKNSLCLQLRSDSFLYQRN